MIFILIISFLFQGVSRCGYGGQIAAKAHAKVPRARLIPASFWLFALFLKDYACFLTHDVNDVNK